MKQLLLKKQNIILLAIAAAAVVAALVLLLPGGTAGAPSGTNGAGASGDALAAAETQTLKDGETPLAGGSASADANTADTKALAESLAAMDAEADASAGAGTGVAADSSAPSVAEQAKARAAEAVAAAEDTYAQRANGGTDADGGTESSGTGGGTVTLSIDCATILNNMDKIDSNKASIVPANGTIMAARAVSFTEGESVFDVLSRECRNSGILVASMMSPVYQSAYIQYIANLGEFDVGSLSGWMYSVNGWYPNYGCSQYALKDGDVVQWRYTCDLGADVGGSGATQG